MTFEKVLWICIGIYFFASITAAIGKAIYDGIRKKFERRFEDRISQHYKKEYSDKCVQLEQAIAEKGARIEAEAIKRYNQTIESCANLENESVERCAKIEAEVIELQARIDEELKKLDERKKEFEEISECKVRSYPWLANAFAEYYHLIEMRRARYLEIKKRPSLKAAESLREIAHEKRALQEQNKLYKYQLDFYESVFPWLEDYKEVDNEDVLSVIKSSVLTETEYESMKRWLSPDEYKELESVERYQLALDRYRDRHNKTNWQVGREYERYIGYVYESKGYKVTYRGAIEGLNDLGRDIIAEKDNEILIVQCKCWREERTVREKHIFQLFGTTFVECEKNPDKLVKGILVTSAKASDIAHKFAKALSVEILENIKFNKKYPCIKCNINRTTKEKIYHLPFDQQYDKIIISLNDGELYVKTVKEAEEMGFRRAFRWHGES